MSNTAPIRIADAVVAEINAANALGTFGVSDFTARRSYPDWDESFKDLDYLAVEVVYSPNEDKPVQLKSYGFVDLEPTVNIVVRKRFGPDDRDESAKGRLLNSSVDPLVTLIDEMRLFFLGKRNATILADEPNAKWSGDSQVRRWYDAAKIRMGLFEGYVQLKFNLSEAI